MSSYILDDNGRRLVEDNIGLVPMTLSKYFCGTKEPREDWLSVGYIALCRAAATYNPEMGIKFSTYAVKCICHGFQRETSKKYATEYIGGMKVTSLNQPVSDYGEPSDDELIDLLIDPSQNTEGEVTDKLFLESIRGLLPLRDEMERECLTLRELAKKKRKPKCEIMSMLRREANRARIKLGLEPMIEHTAMRTKAG